MLMLEYIENRSLDTFVYVTQYYYGDCSRAAIPASRLQHEGRDLKPSNILLVESLNPKIFDFGITRIFEGDEVQERATRRPRGRGTIGYMAPEYANYGIFFFRSDVFSFGVLVLEILSGKKNIETIEGDNGIDLIGHVILHRLIDFGNKVDRSLEILDDTLQGLDPPIEVMRFIRVGLLCVQENIEDRPTMAEVVMMLGRYLLLNDQEK
ncbi:unnamed protein product [Musa acuminata subsp. burmannicoides]